MNNTTVFSKEDLNDFKKRGVKEKQIEKQLENFNTGFEFVKLNTPATVNDGIIAIPTAEEDDLIRFYDEKAADINILKMVPASGSATRMFKALFSFRDKYTGTKEDFLNMVQDKKSDSMYDFFEHLNEFPFYDHLESIIFENGQDLSHMLKKYMYKDILDFILTEKGLNYGGTPKGLVDFHVYRDFVRTAFDEHLIEAALYCKNKNTNTAFLHFTVSEEHMERFKERFEKTSKVFEKMFDVKYNVSFSIQKPSTDTVSIDENGKIVRDENGKILFRPGGHGALIHNLNDLEADIIFIKNIDNVLPDRSKGDTVKYKKMIAGTLLKLQAEVFENLRKLDKKTTAEELDAIEQFVCSKIGYKKGENKPYTDEKSRKNWLYNMLNRPIRICGMVRNEGEPGGGPFWVNTKEGDARLMIIESAQIDMESKEQKKILEHATHFNPVDLVCATRDYKGKKFNLENFVDYEQGFITSKSYHGKDIRVQELPGLWNGAMAKWITLFVEVPLTTFSPVKTVFDLRRIEHRNVFSRNLSEEKK